MEKIDPSQLTATRAQAAIRQRELGVAEYVRALLDRIDAVESNVHAWEIVDDIGALTDAALRDGRLERLGNLPLFGIPFGLKDIYDTRGIPTGAGFPPWRQRVPEFDATTVERLRQAGAVVLGKTVTTQFAFADPPKTRNPWNLERTPGGSSSGSAAAVAARMVPLALGSQTAGSILRPAAYCGVCGLKPTYGLVSRAGIYPLAWSLDHPGPIARSVEDLALALSVLAGPDPKDPLTTGAVVDDYLAAVSAPIDRPRCRVIEDFFEAAQPGVRDVVGGVVSSLGRSGAELQWTRLKTPLDVVASAQQLTMQVEAAEVHGKLFREMPDAYAPRMRALIESGMLVPATAYVHAQRIRRVFREEIAEAFRDADCLLMPTVSNVAPGADTTGDRTFQAPWSFLGTPAITLPAGLSDGLPCGLQIVCADWQDAKLLSIARWVEEVIPPMAAPPL